MAYLIAAHRLSTYPFLHLGLFHTLVNVTALLPLLEKFEEENGTITTVLLFFGRKIPPGSRVTRLNQADNLYSIFDIPWLALYCNMLVTTS